MTPEGKVKKAVKALLDEHGAFHTWPVPGGYGESMLDCVGHHKGHYFEIETKAPGEAPTARQQFRIDRLRESGAKVFVIGYLEPLKRDIGWLTLEAWLLLK